MYFYAPPFSIIKKENDNFLINDVLGGGFEFNKNHLVNVLEIVGKEENSLNESQKKSAEDFLNIRFLEKTRYKRHDYFDYSKVKERISRNEGDYNDLMNIGSVTFALIKQCPYNCSECYAKEKVRKNKISFFREEDVYKAIEQISKLGANNISISGGEPTASRRSLEKTLKIAEIAESFGIPQRLITTGYGLKRYSEELFSSSIKHYQISLDGLKEYNDKYKDYLGATKRSLEAIEECKKQGKDYSINTVITKNNLKQLDKFVNFLEKSGVNNLRITKVISSNPKISLNIAESRKLKEKIEELKRKSTLKISGSFDNQYIQRKNIDCVAGKLYVHIDCFGGVFPCAFMQDIPLGNIYKENFLDLWSLNNPPLKKFERGIIPNPSCIECKDRYFCFGNCRKEYEIKWNV